MSSKERRAEKKAEWEREQAEREIEQRRKESLSMRERIEESGAPSSIKDILHRLAEHVGLE